MIRIHSWAPALIALGGLGIFACSSSDEPSRDDFETDAGSNAPIVTSDAATTDATDAAYDTAPPSKGPFDPADEAVTCTSEPCPVELAAGESHFCARLSDGTVSCWGENARGQLGRADDPDLGVGARSAPGKVEGLEGVKQLTAGGSNTCALLDDGNVDCWGDNVNAQLGLQADAPMSDDGPHPTPAPVVLPSAATRVDIGGQGVGCAVLTSGATWCWGYNGYSQIGRETPAQYPGGPGVPGAPGLAELGGNKVVRTVHGTYTSFGVTDKGDVISWGCVGGAPASIAVRTSSTKSDPTPLPIGLSNVAKLTASTSSVYQPPATSSPPPPAHYLAHACAIVGGDVLCWGESQYGAVATGLPDRVRDPMPAPFQSKVHAQQVTAGGETTCIRLTDGTLQCAGDNRLGALALGDDAGANYSMNFTSAAEFKGHAVQVVASRYSVCALVQGGEVQCWGSNEHGELGQSAKDKKAHGVPVAVKF